MLGNRISWILLTGAAVGSPLLFGSVDGFTVAAWCGVLGLALVTCNPKALPDNHRTLLSLLAAVVIALAFVLHEQIAVRPWLAYPPSLWAEGAMALGLPVTASVSIARNQPWFSIGLPLVAILTLTTSLVVGADRKLAWQLFRALAWAGSVYAIYAIAAELLAPTKVLWRDKQAHIGSLTGTFLNRNTAATFFGSCSILWLLITIEKLRKLLPEHKASYTEVAQTVLGRMSTDSVVSIGMLLLCMSAMFLTRSRAGVILSLAAIFVAAAFRFRRLLSSRISVRALVVVGILLLILLETMGAGVNSRFDLAGTHDYGRTDVYRSTLSMIRDVPWFGSGLGTFEMAFPAYRDGAMSMSGTWNRAHNTLLELASDLGIPLATIIALGWLFIIAQLAVGSLRRRRDAALPTAGLAVGVLGLSHSLVDFSLQIPGYLIPFCAIVGVGIAQSFRSSPASQQQVTPAQRVAVTETT